MDENLGCPDQKTLLGFVSRRLDEAAHQQVQAHLGACKRCSEVVEWIVDNLVKEDTDELEGGSSSTKTFPSDLAARLSAGASGPLNEEIFDNSILAPASKKGTIGRLGKYDVYGVIGQGGMGIVFKAFDEQLRRTVAIKVLNRQLASSAVARRRFTREARAAANIKHENVVTIYDIDETQNCPFLVMEYVGGCSLRDHIRRHRHLDPMEVVRLSQGIAAGLAAAHAQGVIHRDIKPSNIMLEEGNVRVKITDFGLARAAIDNIDLTSQGAAVGTAAYMSPEQVSGNTIDLRSDLFSLGCVMYSMVAGHSPFHGRNSLDIARKVAEHNPPLLEKTHEGTPAMLSEIVARLLEKDPDKRFQSATELAEVLNRYLTLLNQTPTDEMSRVLRTSRLRRRKRWRWLRWAVPAAAVVLIAALSVPLVWPIVGPGRGVLDGPTPGRVPDGQPPSPGPSSITVGPEEEVTSIREALALARPGTEIRVKPGSYVGAVEISGNERFRGLQLVGDVRPDEERPVLLVERGGAPAISISDVSDVLVRGFRIEMDDLPSDTKVPSAIAIQGPAAGITIEDVEHDQPELPSVDSAVRIAAVPRTGQDKPIVLRNCTLDSPTGGQCVRIDGLPLGGQDVRLEGNRFLGRGVLVLAMDSSQGGSVGDLTITENVFLGRVDVVEGRIEITQSTMNGVNLSLQSQAPGRLVRVTNNTFWNVPFWLGLAWSEPAPSEALICNNLILGSYGVEIGSHEQADSAAENWRWKSNWRELVAEGDVQVTLVADAGTTHSVYQVPFIRGTKAEGRTVVRLATEQGQEQIELIQRDDPDAAGFLVPRPGSPLWDSGYREEEGLPGYIGALGPQATGQR